MIRSSLSHESMMARIRDHYRAECDAEAARETQLQFGSSWRDTVALLWGDIMATVIDRAEAPASCSPREMSQR